MRSAATVGGGDCKDHGDLRGLEEQTNGTKWPRFSKNDALAIWDAYPRKERYGPSINAIERALSNIAQSPKAPADPAGWLLEIVKEFAASPAGQRGTKVPFPEKWFSEERYRDDPASWKRVDPEGDGRPSAGGSRKSSHREQPYSGEEPVSL
jgi:hypothetical protein